MATLYKKCTKSITDKQPGIECGFCSNSYHGRCQALSKEQISVFIDIQGSVYKCEDCRNNANIITTAVASTLMQALNDLKDAVNLLQEEVKILKDNKRDDVIDTVLKEMTERRNKEKNIIIYKLDEDTSGNKKEGDLKNVRDILTAIVPEVDTNDIKVFRLRKTSSSHIAPVKVVLNSRDDVFKILSVRKNLKSLNFNIQISTDRTQRQRDKLKATIEELRKRTENGESDLFIKYIHDEPTITPKN